jgi:hypothetical protein
LAISEDGVVALGRVRLELGERRRARERNEVGSEVEVARHDPQVTVGLGLAGVSGGGQGEGDQGEGSEKLHAQVAFEHEPTLGEM